MNFVMPNFALATPEIFLLSMVCVVLLVDLFLKPEQRIVTYALSQLSLIGTAYLVFSMGSVGREVTFSNAYVLDGMARVLKIAICLIVAAVLLYSREYLKDRQLEKGEYYTLALFATLGMLIMSSAFNFLSMYLGLELLSLSLYAMVAFNRDSTSSSEAAMKYFVLGALASGMLLYGISMIYGITGSINFTEVSMQLGAGGANKIVAMFALSFIVVGLAFKLGAVPFHMWIPDVYQGAQTPVTLFIGSAPKIAAFAMVMRVLVDGLGSLSSSWQLMLVILVVLSIVLGNVVAIAQTNIKRMLAYSTISHVGFILMGVLAGTSEGYSAAMFYTIVYTMMTLGAFGMILFLSRTGFEAEELNDFKGLNARNPWLALLMLIFMFSMAGVPPLVGFHAKLAVLRAAVQADFVWLAVVAVLLSVVGAFYYLRVVKLMYFDEAEDTSEIRKTFDFRCLLSINGLLVLGLGIFPAGLMTVCVTALSW